MNAPSAGGRPAWALRKRDFAAILLFGLLVHGVSIWGRVLAGRDEPRVAGIARAMAETGDYLLPRLNGRPFLEYPPLGYWPAALALQIAGTPSALAAHAAGVAWALATLCVTAVLGARLFGRPGGVAAALILATTPGFWGLHRQLYVDPALVFCVTASLTAFHVAWHGGPRARAGAWLAWGALGCGFLAKGLLGIGIPCAAAFVYALILRERDGLRRLASRGAPLAAAAVVGGWLAAVAARDGREPAAEVVRQSFHRFTSSSADHAAPVWFYFGPIFYVTAPLILLIGVDLIRKEGMLRRRISLRDSGAALPLAWFVTTLAALCAASAKRQLYLAPLMPAAALLSAALWTHWSAWKFGAARAAAAAWLVGFVAFAVAACVRPFLNEDQGRDFVAPVARIAQAGGGAPWLLVRPTEGVEGACAFVLGKPTPVVRSDDELRDALARDPKRIIIFELTGDETPDFLRDAGGEFETVERSTVGRSTVLAVRRKKK